MDKVSSSVSTKSTRQNKSTLRSCFYFETRLVVPLSLHCSPEQPGAYARAALTQVAWPSSKTKFCDQAGRIAEQEAQLPTRPDTRRAGSAASDQARQP